MEANQDINQLIDNLKEVEPIEPSPFMFAKIKYKIEQQKSGSQDPGKNFFVSTSIAIAMMLLIMVNIWAVYHFSQQSNDNQPDTYVSDNYTVATDTDFNY